MFRGLAAYHIHLVTESSPRSLENTAFCGSPIKYYFYHTDEDSAGTQLVTELSSKLFGILEIYHVNLDNFLSTTDVFLIPQS